MEKFFRANERFAMERIPQDGREAWVSLGVWKQIVAELPPELLLKLKPGEHLKIAGFSVRCHSGLPDTVGAVHFQRAPRPHDQWRIP
jgi:hypothetical protein